MSEEYYEGKGCKCYARSENECGCNADWTSPEVYKLRAEIEQLRKENERLKSLRFPVSLRKMWSGVEVQNWLYQRLNHKEGNAK